GHPWRGYLDEHPGSVYVGRGAHPPHALALAACAAAAGRSGRLSMRYYWHLYANYWRLFVKTLAQYRADVAIMIGAAAVQEGATLLFIGIIFSNIQQLQGWTFAEVLMTWGLMTITSGLWNVTLDVPHRIHWYIRLGDLDYLLVRPTGILFQIAGTSGLNPTSIGRVVVGIAALVIAVREQGIAIEWWW